MRSATLLGVVLIVVALLAGLGEGAPSFSITSDEHHIFLGQSITVTMELNQELIRNLSLRVYCYVDQKEWGASTTLRSGQHFYKVLLPFPNHGQFNVQCVLQQNYVPQNRWYTGSPISKAQVHALSNNLIITVQERSIVNPTNLWNDHRQIGMEFETWFGNLNWNWDLAEAVPIVGQYDSWNVDVIKQHAIWLTMAGVDFVMVDWTNNLGNPNGWVNRGPNIQQLINQTTLLVETYAKITRLSGPFKFIPPKIVLLFGVGPAPPGIMTALNQQLQYVHDNYISKYPAHMFVHYQNKPLVVILDLPELHNHLTPPINDTLFTVRWMSTQLQDSHQNLQGYWSWMDGSIDPIVTYNPVSKVPEAVTTAVSFFKSGVGWLYNATAKLDGTTFIQETKASMKAKPEFTLICQWNEFAGQPEGQGYGPKHDIYYDIYNITLGNDLEPVSMSECGYRGCGGYGYYYLNLLQATTTLLHQSNGRGDVDWAVLGVGKPTLGQNVSGSEMEVMWNVIGKLGDKIEIYVDKKLVKTVEDFAESGSVMVSLKGLAVGAKHVLEFFMYGTRTPFDLPYTKLGEGYHRKNMKSPIVIERSFDLV
eukprot:TRINITY_DN23018_c0_g1_i1.p1 TRINITY_DN23018_c0_g1~~TRINITY_DN23018_c0_g1_i1.p1  ORF type:complete len:591 (-),score=112.18 TRINITY_DN23018_c0_g1_i1:2-1774(-)